MPEQLHLPTNKRRPWEWRNLALRLEVKVMDLEAEVLRLRKKVEEARRARVIDAMDRFHENVSRR